MPVTKIRGVNINWQQIGDRGPAEYIAGLVPESGVSEMAMGIDQRISRSHALGFSIRGKSATGGLILCPGFSPSPYGLRAVSSSTFSISKIF